MRAVGDDFLDVRGHGFARVAVCVPQVRVGDPVFNADAHQAVLERVHAEGAHYALCPELGLSGYTCGDLFFQETLLRTSVEALARLAADTARWNLVLSVGLPLVVDDLLFNCAVTLYGGRPVAVAPKAYPPNYREFYELRWFHPAAEARATEVTLFGHRVPFGTDVLVRATHLPGFVLHTDICEDLWTPVPPGTIAALSGATVLGNLSASNVTVGKWEYRQDLVRSSSAKNLAVQLYSAAGFGESTADLAWDGQGLIAERGEIVAATERFSLGGNAVTVDIDLRALVEDRLRQSSWGQNAAEYGHALRTVDVGDAADARPASLYDRLLRRIEPHPFVPADPARRDVRCRETFLITSTSLARRLEALPEDGRRVVLGVSGGQDSAQALLVAAHAMDLLGLPRSRIIGVTLPGFGTSRRTYENACALVRTIGATLREVDIKLVAGEMFTSIGHDPSVEDRTFENVQAWARKFLLFSLASREHGIDLGTSDLTELALGFTTYGGDHMSHYGVNAGVPKTLVSAASWTPRSAPSCCVSIARGTSHRRPRRSSARTSSTTSSSTTSSASASGRAASPAWRYMRSTGGIRSRRSGAGSSSSSSGSSRTSSSATASPTRRRSARVGPSPRAATGACRRTHRRRRGSLKRSRSPRRSVNAGRQLRRPSSRRGRAPAGAGARSATRDSCLGSEPASVAMPVQPAEGWRLHRCGGIRRSSDARRARTPHAALASPAAARQSRVVLSTRM